MRYRVMVTETVDREYEVEAESPENALQYGSSLRQAGEPPIRANVRDRNVHLLQSVEVPQLAASNGAAPDGDGAPVGYLDVEDVVSALDISRATVTRWLRTDTLHGVKRNGRWLIPQSEIDRALGRTS